VRQCFALKVLPEHPVDDPTYLQYQATFYAGALCLFNWFMVQLDPGEEATTNDLGKVDRMCNEINGFFEERF